MAQQQMCAAHPSQPASSCGRCEPKIEAARDRASGLWDPPDAWQRGQDQYEKFLNRALGG